MRYILNIIKYLIIVLIAILVGAFLTGRIKREYKVLGPDEMIQVNNKVFDVDSLAKEYEPILYLRRDTYTPELKWCWYEIVANGATVDLIYYFVWENEINPNKVYHKLYSTFRAAYFGYPLYDIEYFQVRVNKISGEIEKLQFETSASDDYSQEIVKHITVQLVREQNGNFTESRKSGDGQFIKVGNASFEKQNNRVKVGNLTWNHLSKLLAKGDENLYSTQIDTPSKYLTDNDYSKYKFSRKGHGDYFSEENKLVFYGTSILIFSILIIASKKLKKK